MSTDLANAVYDTVGTKMRERLSTDSHWSVARKVNHLRGRHITESDKPGLFARLRAHYKGREAHDPTNSKRELEALGFQITSEDRLFYEVQPPEAWSKVPGGNPRFWEDIQDPTGKVVISQFYDAMARDAFINIREVT